MDHQKVIDEIERLLSKQFNPNHKDSRTDKKDMTTMFSKNLVAFTNYLKDDLAIKVSDLKETFFLHSFDSPLDFIMIKSDFKRFFESFT